jgi:hypothetical protein
MLDQAAWVNGLIIVGGSMLVAAVVTLLIRPRLRAPSGESHNEVAGTASAARGPLARLSALDAPQSPAWASR